MHRLVFCAKDFERVEIFPSIPETGSLLFKSRPPVALILISLVHPSKGFLLQPLRVVLVLPSLLSQILLSPPIALRGLSEIAPGPLFRLNRALSPKNPQAFPSRTVFQPKLAYLWTSATLMLYPQELLLCGSRGPLFFFVLTFSKHTLKSSFLESGDRFFFCTREVDLYKEATSPAVGLFLQHP